MVAEKTELHHKKRIGSKSVIRNTKSLKVGLSLEIIKPSNITREVINQSPSINIETLKDATDSDVEIELKANESD